MGCLLAACKSLKHSLRSIPERRTPEPSLHRHALGQVARLVDVAAAQHGDVIGQQLQRDDRHERLQEVVDVGHVDHVVGQVGHVACRLRTTTAITGPPRALISSRFDITLSYTEPCGIRNTLGVCSSTRAIGPCFISAAG